MFTSLLNKKLLILAQLSPFDLFITLIKIFLFSLLLILIFTITDINFPIFTIADINILLLQIIYSSNINIHKNK